MLISAINLISCLNFSITCVFLTHLWGIIGIGGYLSDRIYVFLIYLWGVLFNGGCLSEGHTQGITRL